MPGRASDDAREAVDAMGGHLVWGRGLTWTSVPVGGLRKETKGQTESCGEIRLGGRGEGRGQSLKRT